jgi:dehydrogenase/reductase SDR family member 12
MPTLTRFVDAALEAAVVPSFSRIGPAVRRRLADWTPVTDLPGAGRTVLVTGANSGLGLATAHGLAAAGAAVRLLVRSDAKGAETAAHLRVRSPEVDVAWYVADLADLASVRRVAEEIQTAEPRLDALINNAGAMFERREVTEEGIERTIALHVAGPHLLTTLLLDRLAGGRVVWVSSGGMYTQRLDVDRLQSPTDYAPATAYARAKRAQVVLAREWQRRVGAEQGIAFHAMHPGWALTPGVETSLPAFRKVMGPLLRTPEEGADTSVWLALSPAADRGGAFWLDRRPRSTVRLPATGTAPTEAHRLWDEVERLTAGG